MTRNIFVLDTNVLLHDPFALYKFQEHKVIIPIVVVEEIDKFKRDQSEVGRNARAVSRFLDNERKKGNLSKGVKLESGGELHIALASDEVKTGLSILDSNKSADNWILGVAVHFANKIKRGKCVLVTKDANLRIKADAVGILAEDYSNDKVQEDEIYQGWIERRIPEDTLREFETKGSMAADEDDPALDPNVFVHMINEDDEDDEILARVLPAGDLIAPVSEDSLNVWGIEPLNFEQRMAMELLLDPHVKLVSLIGKAGTGKTLMALAAGLQMVVDERKYTRLMVARPVQPLGKDLGYLPGDVDEKIRPWMQPIFDNLEYILHCNSEELSKSHITYQYFIEKGWMLVEPLTYMRGRSIPNQYMLVDEAQNLTPHEIKSIITRSGHGTKIVLTGDPHQIDHPFLDATTNGISYLVKRFQNQPLYGHITLTKGERSDLAEAATNLL